MHEDEKHDPFAAVRGILNGLCLSVVLWALFVVAVMLVRV